MRKPVLAAVIAISLCVVSAAKDKAGKQSGGTEQSVLAIEKEMLDALLKGDASANERYLAETYVFTGPDGMTENKAQSVADLKSGDLKFQSASLDDAKVNVYGDTAIVTFGSTDKATYKGKDISGKTRWTDVFVKRNGKWQIVASHGSRVAE
jgi:ketosteroid isomerase-like protein